MTDFQTQFNADVNAIISDAYNEDFMSNSGGTGATTFSATLTLLRADAGDEIPSGEYTIIRAEVRWQESDYSGAKSMDRFKRVNTGDFWYIPEGLAPEVDNFGEVIAQMAQRKQTRVGAV